VNQRRARRKQRRDSTGAARAVLSLADPSATPSRQYAINRCLILAAGRGTRVSGAKDSKPLEVVGGLALIERTILTASRAGLTEFYVVTGHAAANLEVFLGDLASRRGLAITAIRSKGWEAGNAASLLAAREHMAEPFALLMADHVFDDAILRGLIAASRVDADVVLACDYAVGGNAWVDEADATKVQIEGDRIVPWSRGGVSRRPSHLDRCRYPP